MNIQKKLIYITTSLIVTACNNKIPESGIEKVEPEESAILHTNKNQNSIEGIYSTQADSNESSECKISVEITKTKDGYSYIFKTKSKNLKGVAELTEESGEKILVLKGIKWDYYEGEMSDEEGSDSISDKEPVIPVDIGASYVQDTLTIQNYGNAMNSYTKIEDCGRKYIQLIKK
ncbi:MAG: hypothetical protein EOO44_05490 [Flavobacterium sp.]|nr:MAG: hypothetical protein EOO44_05490 [Flavobacterium sp.]